MPALHLLQSSLVHVNTLLLREVLDEPKWAKTCAASVPARPPPSSATASTAWACSPRCRPRPCSACSARPAVRPPTGPAASTRAPTPRAACQPPVSVRHRFPHDVLDGVAARSALLGLVVQLGAELRRRGQAARAITLTLTFAGGPAWETRRLPEPSGHEDDLRQLTYQLMDAAGLQRGRLTALALRAADLADGDQVAEQLSLDAARQARLTAEQAADRIREKFGPGAIGPAATYRPAS
ncbi:hypothetical protein [Streptomyces sp.]|uniref:DinB/UmuC family translesion DNA polymerase n=1 Tax=Streptomyces sp. TaxID=1931 RepID=UPI00345645E2